MNNVGLACFRFVDWFESNYLHYNSPIHNEMRANLFIRWLCLFIPMLLLIVLAASGLHGQDFKFQKKHDYKNNEIERVKPLLQRARDVSESEAVKLYKQAAASFESIYERAIVNEDYELAVVALNNLADTQRRYLAKEKSLETLKRAKQILINHIPVSSILWSETYLNAGVIEHRWNDYYRAIDFLDSAQLLYEKAAEYDSAIYQDILDYKFYAYWYSKSNVDTLLKYIKVRIDFEEAVQKDNFNPDEILYIRQDYPRIYLAKGEYDMALAYAISNYKYLEENSRKIYDGTKHSILYDLAWVLYQKREFQKALDIAMESYATIPKDVNYTAYLDLTYLMGLLYNGLDQPVESNKYFQKVLDANIDARLGAQRGIFKANALLSVGLNMIAMGKVDEARKLMLESLERVKALVNFPSSDMFQHYRYIGDFYASQNNWNSALLNYDSALRNTELNYPDDILAFPKTDSASKFSFQTLTVLTKKAQALSSMSRQDSVDYLEAALDYVDNTHFKLQKNRNDLYQAEGKLYLSQFFKDLYEAGISAAYQLYMVTKDDRYTHKGFYYAQLSKANLFLEQSKNYQSLVGSNVPYELKEEYFLISNELQELKNQLYESLDNSVTSDSVIKVNDQILVLQERLLRIKDSIENNYVSGLLQYESEPSAPALLKGQLLMEYFVGKENIYVFGFDASGKVVFRRSPYDSELTSHLETMIAIVSRPPNLNGGDITAQMKDFEASSYFLFKKLVSPVLNQFKAEEILLIPDELLTRIPFEALITRAPQNDSYKTYRYLVRDYKVRYALSSNNLKLGSFEKKATKNILGMGYSGVQSSSQPIRSQFAALPGTDTEIKFLRARFDGTYYLGMEGSKSKFLEEASDYDIIHLAIHGKADSISRFQSSLIFNGQDSLLSTSQLYLANLNARLAVLSACESGTGTSEKGEGTFSIARGFAIVGVDNIVMSLWEVNDKITSEQMVSFYNGFLEQRNDLNTSLRNMKLGYLEANDSYSCHPYYWASFIHLGSNMYFDDGGASKNIMYWLLGFVIVAVLILLIWYRNRKRAY